MIVFPFPVAASIASLSAVPASTTLGALPASWEPPKPAIIRPVPEDCQRIKCPGTARAWLREQRRRKLDRGLSPAMLMGGLGVTALSGGGVGVGEEGAPVFTPGEVEGLEEWLRSDVGVTKDGGDLVSSWTDQSGNSRDVTQATGSKQPLWVDAQANGYPIIRGDGTDDVLTKTSVVIAQPLTVFIVTKAITLAGRPFATSDGADNNSPSMAFNTTAGGTALIIGGGISGATIAGVGTTEFRLFTCIFNGTNSTIAMDDGVAQTSAADLSGSTDRLNLFTRFEDGGSFYNGDTAEMAIYSGAVSGSDLTNLKTYFNARYGLW